MTTVRAKFVVEEKTKNFQGRDAAGNPVTVDRVKLRAVYGDSPENKKFFSASPSGVIELGVLNPDASNALVIGEEYYVDFTPAKADSAS
jgi:hypothetical protein